LNLEARRIASPFEVVLVAVEAQFQERASFREVIVVCEIAKVARTAAKVFLAMALLLATVNLPAQEARKVISNPAPIYPEMARRLRLIGVVKLQVVISPDGKITSTKVIGGHPVLVNSVEETLKNWKYAPASTETTTQLEFNFHP
jgi:TonB family protein